ncbi:MAG: hypothetical protein EXX96DRAFT_553701 [Benjaminiella poitrasii]|nr:MAG: hypothetical protein EXX96DRAFT_553701 [Benjaminiella poitrasii]
MPKTPPLILPTSLPGSWINRSNINKRLKPNNNIYKAQNKTDESEDDYTFLSRFNNETSVIDNNDISSSIILAMDQPNYINRGNSMSPSNSNTALNQDKDVNYTPIANNVVPKQRKNSSSQSSFKSSYQEKDQQIRNTIIEEQKDDSKIEFHDEPNNQFQDLLTASEELSKEFKKFMNEHQEIKRSIDEKKEELELYIRERMQYLDQRQSYFHQQIKSLKEYI